MSKLLGLNRAKQISTRYLEVKRARWLVVWVDNDNVVRGLEKRRRIERADAAWAVAEN